MIVLSFIVWVAVCVGLWWVLSYQSDTVPAHDRSRRYQELRKRPGEEDSTVVRSFRYSRNALKWADQCDHFPGTLEFLDTKTGRTLYKRELH